MMLTHSSSNPKLRLPHFSSKPGLKVRSSFSSTSFIRNSQQHRCQTSLFPPANQSVAAILFGDGSSSRLYPLTKRRSEGAIPIAGSYRLIDAVVSNCINSNITKIYALTQFNSTSLNSHLARAYSGVNLGKEGFVEVVAACQSPENSGWYQGTADAIRRCLWLLEEYPILEFLVLPAHHLYKMDYQKLIEVHRDRKADITVSVLSTKTQRNEDVGFGIFKVNGENQVMEFIEKPDSISAQNSVKSDENVHQKFPGMGIYVITRNIMRKLLMDYFPLANHLKTEIIPGAISLGLKIYPYEFNGYWEDMRSISAYYRANMDTIPGTNEAYNLYDRDSPLYTLPRRLPPTLITDAEIIDSTIADGCILSKCKIKGSIIGTRTKICNHATIEDSLILGSDTYHQISSLQSGISPPIGIGESSHIRKAIIDKNARIGKNVMIINKDKVEEGNREEYGYIISGGIIVILRNATIPDGSIL